MNPQRAKEMLVEALDQAKMSGTIAPAWLADAIEQAIEELS